MAANKYDWRFRAFGRDASLHVETIEARKGDVKDQAGRNESSRPREEFLCRRECSRLPPFATDHPLQRFAHRNVVIGNKHDWCDIRHNGCP